MIETQKKFQELVSFIPPLIYKEESISKDLKKSKYDPKVRELENIEPEINEEIEVKPMTVSNAVELKQKLRERIEELRSKRGEPKSKKELLTKRKAKKINPKGRPANTGAPKSTTAPIKPNAPSSTPMNVSFRLDFGEKSVNRGDKRSKLIKAEKQKERLQQKPQELRKQKEDEMKWQKMEKQAKGEKVADIQMLKKAIKKEKQRKKKSSKEWEEREKLKIKEMEQRQQKRQQNIQQRKDQKLAKKRPGFEGKVKKK